MKSTAVEESLSSMNQQFYSRENQLLQMLQQNEKSTQKDFPYQKQWYTVSKLLDGTECQILLDTGVK